MIYRHVRLRTRMINSLLIFGFSLMFSVSNAAEIKLSPQWTERYLFKHMPELVKNSHTDHVLAFYYFGSFQDLTIMGMERVKGDDYEPHHTILIFKDSILQGYYKELLVFPAGVSEQGQVFFPANRLVNANIDLAHGHYPTIIFNKQADTASSYIQLIPEK
jgi:hypothetical protein